MPEQYSDDATLRGDAFDGPPGVAGIGEQTAASLLAAAMASATGLCAREV